LKRGASRSRLGSTPQLDELDTIVAHALTWERMLVDLRSTAAAAGQH